MKKTFFRMLTTLIILFILIFGALFFFQEKMIFFPDTLHKDFKFSFKTFPDKSVTSAYIGIKFPFNSTTSVSLTGLGYMFNNGLAISFSPETVQFGMIYITCSTVLLLMRMPLRNSSTRAEIMELPT